MKITQKRLQRPIPSDEQEICKTKCVYWIFIARLFLKFIENKILIRSCPDLMILGWIKFLFQSLSHDLWSSLHEVSRWITNLLHIFPQNIQENVTKWEKSVKHLSLRQLHFSAYKTKSGKQNNHFLQIILSSLHFSWILCFKSLNDYEWACLWKSDPFHSIKWFLMNQCMPFLNIQNSSNHNNVLSCTFEVKSVLCRHLY